MIQLSKHFDLREFGGDIIPAACIPAFAVLCVEILEPVREHVESPVHITSGYRSPEDNTAAHGQPNSEHMATANWCAADFFCQTIHDVFDWMRHSPVLPYHQLILEKGKLGYVIHVSYNRLKPGVRSVLVGATNNSEPYQIATSVPFNPGMEVSA